MKQPDRPAAGNTAADRAHDRIAARLEALPARGRARLVIVVAALAVFFDLGDGASLGLVAPTLRDAIGLTTGLFAFGMSATFIGSFIGASVGGRLADRYGRIRMFRVALGVTTIFTLAQSLVQTPAELIILRFFAGIGIGSLFVFALIYIVELSPPSRRTARTAIVSAIGVGGSAVFATLARLIIPHGPEAWRFVFCISALAVLLYIPLRLLPESPLWLVSRGRFGEADAAMDLMEKHSGAGTGEAHRPADDIGAGVITDTSTGSIDDPATPESTSEQDVRLTRGPLLVSLVLVSMLMMLYSTVAQSFTNWLPTILDTRGFDSSLALTVTAFSLYGAPIGAALVYVFSSYFSRWKMMLGLALLACASVAVFFASTSTVVVIAAAFIVVAVSGAYSPLTNVTAGEEFPTPVRASGMGIAHSTTRVANSVAPFWLAAVVNSGLLILGSFIFGLWLAIIGVVTALRARHFTQQRQSDQQTDPAQTALSSSSGSNRNM